MTGRDRNRPPARLGEVMANLVQQRHWSARLSQEAAVAAWPAVVGEELARHCVALRVRAGTLHVAVRSGTWATQLTFFRTDLVRRLKAAGCASVRDIAFRVGLPPDSTLRWPSAQRPDPLPAAAVTPEDLDVARRLRSGAGADELAQGFERWYLAAVARSRRLSQEALGGPPAPGRVADRSADP